MGYQLKDESLLNLANNPVLQQDHKAARDWFDSEYRQNDLVKDMADEIEYFANYYNTKLQILYANECKLSQEQKLAITTYLDRMSNTVIARYPIYLYQAKKHIIDDDSALEKNLKFVHMLTMNIYLDGVVEYCTAINKKYNITTGQPTMFDTFDLAHERVKGMPLDEARMLISTTRGELNQDIFMRKSVGTGLAPDIEILSLIKEFVLSEKELIESRMDGEISRNGMFPFGYWIGEQFNWTADLVQLAQVLVALKNEYGSPIASLSKGAIARVTKKRVLFKGMEINERSLEDAIFRQCDGRQSKSEILPGTVDVIRYAVLRDLA